MPKSNSPVTSITVPVTYDLTVERESPNVLQLNGTPIQIDRLKGTLAFLKQEPDPINRHRVAMYSAALAVLEETELIPVEPEMGGIFKFGSQTFVRAFFGPEGWVNSDTGERASWFQLFKMKDPS